jgi:osmotically inducible protein OsmC
MIMSTPSSSPTRRDLLALSAAAGAASPVPTSVRAATGDGANPEQLFAACWSARFERAIGLVAHRWKITLPAGRAVDAEVNLRIGDGGYVLSARLSVSLPGIERAVAQALVDEAQQICPYSKATRGNIDVTINLV